jgi:hypothetical protein
MSQYVLPFPLLPGKTEDDARIIANEFKSRPREYEESRKNAGVLLERAYLEKTPMGSFVVSYVESERDFTDSVRLMLESGFALDRFFRDKVKEIHGLDMADPMPRFETVASWFDPQVSERGRGLAFCAPLAPDRVNDAKTYLHDAYQTPQFAASRRSLGQNGEVASLIETPQGPIGAAYLEGRDPVEANRRFAESTDPFDVAFKEHLAWIFQPGVDFSQPLPPIEEVFDSTKVASLGAVRRVA